MFPNFPLVSFSDPSPASLAVTWGGHSFLRGLLAPFPLLNLLQP